MAQEIDEVKALLTDKTTVKIANREFVVGKIGNVRCVVVFSKWGKVAATITATLLIQEFAVTDLIFIGTAGFVHQNMRKRHIHLRQYPTHCLWIRKQFACI